VIGGDMKLVLAVLLLLVATGNAQSAAIDSPAAFQRLTSLVGDWEGRSEWTGARTGTGKMNATYYLTGNSSALVENLLVEGSPVMTTVYHLDHSDIRMTHFCAAKNQPRLKASKIDLQKGVIDFTFIDVTNVPSLDAPFVHGLEIQLLDPDKIALTFTFEAAGKKSFERIDLERVVAHTAK
jgi:hypothetical protein